MSWLFDAEIWIGLFTLTGLEIVLGIDNLVFISILSGRLPVAQQSRARRSGLMLALIMRVLLLLSLSWIMGLTEPLFSVAGTGISGRSLILIGGGLFLLAKSTREIHHRIEEAENTRNTAGSLTFSGVLTQIVLLDIVFSLDSVITAVGMVDQIGVMIAAVIIAMVIMIVSANAISAFIERHPTLKMLALSFLLLIGVNLMAEGVGFHIPKGYTYFAMGFSLLVEFLNRKVGKRTEPTAAG